MNPDAPSPSLPHEPENTSASAPGIIDATEPNPLKQIRTYQGDIAEAIKSQHASVYSMREAERARASLLEKRDAANTSPAPVEKTPMSEETKRRITSLLLALGGLILNGGAPYAGFLD